MMSYIFQLLDNDAYDPGHIKKCITLTLVSIVVAVEALSGTMLSNILHDVRDSVTR
jgi:hypothetical protein